MGETTGLPVIGEIVGDGSHGIVQERKQEGIG